MDFNRAALARKQEAAKRYHANLTDDVLKYLDSRGIDESIAREFQLGVCDDLYPGRLSIPYLRPSGVMWINYRALNGETPKYIAPGAKHLYNTGALKKADQTGEIAIAEGEIDTITAHELYETPCVGVPGATQWTGNRHWHALFEGYQRVNILADPDEAGMSLAAAIMETLPAARVVRLPYDVNDCKVNKISKEEFKELMK